MDYLVFILIITLLLHASTISTIATNCNHDAVHSYESCVTENCAIDKEGIPPRRCTTQYSVYEEVDSFIAKRIRNTCHAHSDCTLHMPLHFGLRCCAERACDQLKNSQGLFTKPVLESLEVVNAASYRQAYDKMCLQFWNRTTVDNKCAVPSQYEENSQCLKQIFIETSTKRSPQLYDTVYGPSTLRVYCDSNVNQCKHAIIHTRVGTNVSHPLLISFLLVFMVIVVIWIVFNGIDQTPWKSWFHFEDGVYQTLKEHASVESDDDDAFDDLFDAPEMDMLSLSEDENV